MAEQTNISATHSGYVFNRLQITTLANNKVLLKIIFFTLLTYSIFAVFPISPIEADGIGITNGVEVMLNQGLVNNEFAYRFAAQPGSYVLIYWVCKLFKLKAYLAFSIITAISNLIFIFASSFLISKIADVNFHLIGFLHLIFQELLAIGAYANTTIIACAFILLGFVLLYHWDKAPSTILAALLIGFGIFCRLDAGIIVFAYAIYLMWEKKKLPLNLLISGILSILFFYFLLQINHISIQDITQILRLHSGIHFKNESIQGIALIGYMDVRSIISFFSIASLGLIFFGLLNLLLRKNWKNLVFILLGTVPVFYLLFGSLTTPKYLISTLPFFILAIYFGIQFLTTQKTTFKKVLSILLLLIFFSQYFLGIQVDVSSKPYREEMKPVILKLLSIAKPISSIENVDVVIGSGSSISTDDGYRLTSGIAYYPIFWHQEKAKRNSGIAPLYNQLESDQQSTIGILCNDYDACQLSKNALLSNQYELTTIEENVYQGIGINNIILYIQDNGTDYTTIHNNLDAIESDQILFVSTIPGTNYNLQSNIPTLQKTTDLVYIYNK